jgi:pimeloyl-ACP methyl ester carboxylesterase
VRGLRLMAHRAPRALARASHLPAVAADDLVGAISEGMHQAAGVLDEYHTMSVPWGFEPSSISTATEVWQGDHDALVPANWGARLADAIPAATRHDVPGGTHFLAFDRWDEILDGFAPST